MAFATQTSSRHAQFGQQWGEGAARCFSIEQGDFLDEDQAVRLLPVPESFFCPISTAIMADPVATVDGGVYEREYIERWFRERRQNRQPITSPVTGLELPTQTLMPLLALQKAIEAYLAHRPELRRDHMAGRSFEEAAQMLQSDLFEKQAMHATVQDKLRRLREANRSLTHALHESEVARTVTLRELGRLRRRPGPGDAGEEAEEDGQVPASIASAMADTGADGLAAGTSRCGVSPCDVPPTRPADGDGGAEGASAAAGAAAASGRGPPAARRRKKDADLQRLRVGGARCCRWDVALALPGALLVFALTASLLGLRLLNLLASPGATVLGAPGALPPGTARREGANRGGEGEQRWAALTGGAAGAVLLGAGGAPAGVGVAGVAGPALLAGGGPEEGPEFARQLDKLRHGSLDEKQRAAFMLRNLATDNAENQLAIAKAGALGPLVGLLEDHAPKMREEAARALWNLMRNNKAINVNNQMAIARAGAVAPLIRCLEDEVPRVRIVAAAMLKDLATDSSENQVAIARSGVAAPLARLLREDEAAALVMAVGLLQSLAQGGVQSGQAADAQVSVALSGAIAPLAELLKAGTLLAQEEATRALGILAAYSPEMQVAVARAGVIGPLVGRLKGDMMQGTAALALGNLAAGNTENQVAIAQAGAIVHLVKLLEDGMPGVREEAAQALWRLSRGNVENQGAVIRAEAVIPLIALLKGDAQEQATIALYSWQQ